MKVVEGTEGLEERIEGRKNYFNMERGKKDEKNNNSA